MTRDLPQNTCPLCRQPALDQSSSIWFCESCGCGLEFDPQTRRCRCTQVPIEYAAIGAQLGSRWLTRREMFECVDAARSARLADITPERKDEDESAYEPAHEPEPEPEQDQTSASASAASTRGIALITAFGLLFVCVMMCAIAAALALGPSVSRTRRMIAGAFAPTPTSTSPVAPAQVIPTVAPDGRLASPLTTPAPAPTQVLALTATPELQSPPTLSVTLTVITNIATPTPPQLAAPALQSPIAASTLPPTFTPAPPTVSAAATSTLAPTMTSAPTITATVVLTLTPTPTVGTALGSPVATPTPTVQGATPTAGGATLTPTPPPSGGVVLSGTIAVVNVKRVGDKGINEADEYVELRNNGPQQVNMQSWQLRAYGSDANNAIATFDFPGGFVMSPGEVCRVYTGLSAQQDSCGLRGFGLPSGLWPDVGPARASLFNPQSQEMARFTY